MRSFKSVFILLALSFLSGCGALTAVSRASASMDDYTLSPITSTSQPIPGTTHLVVEMPVSAGALANDRILIKPVPFEAQYLPDAQWAEPAPALVQSLLVGSFQNIGGFRLVGRTGLGLMPDYTLMTDLQEFQTEPVGKTKEPLVVNVSATMTLIRESDRTIIASRKISSSVGVLTDDTVSIVRGFDSATRLFMQEAVSWTLEKTR